MASELSPMQQELLNRADAIFAAIGNAVSAAKDFAAEQVPDIAMQYVAFGRAYNTTTVVLAFLVLMIGLYLFVNVGVRNTHGIADNTSSYHKEWGGSRVLAAFVGGIMSIISAITVLVNIKDALMVWFAPKVWLITEMVYLARAVRGR